MILSPCVCVGMLYVCCIMPCMLYYMEVSALSLFLVLCMCLPPPSYPSHLVSYTSPPLRSLFSDLLSSSSF